MPLDKESVAKIVEYGSRIADDQNKLTTRFSEIADVIREANFWAMSDNSTVIKKPLCKEGAGREDFQV
ncbi:MAG: Lon-insertion domain-containing protein [Candidatus Ratteibacteria bacterium]